MSKIRKTSVEGSVSRTKDFSAFAFKNSAVSFDQGYVLQMGSEISFSSVMRL